MKENILLMKMMSINILQGYSKIQQTFNNEISSDKLV